MCLDALGDFHATYVTRQGSVAERSPRSASFSLPPSAMMLELHWEFQLTTVG